LLREEGSHDHLTEYKDQLRINMANPLGFSIVNVVIIIEMQNQRRETHYFSWIHLLE